MKVTDCTPDERDAIQHNRCPDCGNYGFHDGPRGGLSQNIFCCNPQCRSGFNVGPLLIMVQRIGRGPLCYYPPLVHITVADDLALCCFVMHPPPWPRGHYQGGARFPEITCPVCIDEATRRTGNLRRMLLGK